jgi:hypothetical protein
MGASSFVTLGGVGSALTGAGAATGIFGTKIDRAEGLYGSKTGATGGGSLGGASGADGAGSGVGDLAKTNGGVAMRASTGGGGGTGSGGGMRVVTR